MRFEKASHPSLHHLPPFLRWWCEITTPVHSSQPFWREELASLVLPIALLDTIFGALAAIGNWPQFAVLATAFMAILFAIVLKRLGQFFTAGVLATCSLEMGVGAHIVTWPHLGPAQLPLYALLIQTGFVAIAFFPPAVTLLIGAFNCAFLLLSLHFLPISAEMTNTLARDGAEVLAPMISLQVFVSVITWIVMVTLTRTILRADRAEEVALLERNARLQQEREIELKAQLEEGFEKILMTLNTASAQGDLSIRVPLSQSNVLWRVGYAVNNLLARLQGSRQETKELQKTQQVVVQLVDCIRRKQHFPLTEWTGTSLDPLIIEFNKQYGTSTSNPIPPSDGRWQ